MWIGWPANRSFEFLRAVNPVEDDCFDVLVYVSVYIVLQSRWFLKNIENFLFKWKLVNNHSIPLTHAERKISIGSHKHSFTPYPSLSPYSPTDGKTDRGTN